MKLRNGCGVLALLALSALSSFGYSKYTYNVYSTMSSLTIEGATHNLGGTALAVRVRDASGAVLPSTAYTYSIDGSSYDVALNFDPSLTSGAHVYILGNYSGSDSTDSGDFQVTGNSNTLKICAGCSSYSIAQRTYMSHVYVLSNAVTFYWDIAPGTSVDVRVYILDNKVVFAGGSGFYPLASCSGVVACEVTGNVAGFPYGSIPLGHTSWTGASWTSITDDRPYAFQ